jgi:hypothetical protein
MIGEYKEQLFRKFDPNKDYMWMCMPAKGRFGCIAVGAKIDELEVGNYYQGEYMIRMDFWDKVQSIRWNLVVVYGPAHEKEKNKIP